MGKKGRIVLATLLAVALCGLIFHFLGQREPTYQGKPLQYYLDQFAAHYPQQKSADDPNMKAIYAMGPEALPHLRSAFRKKNSSQVKVLQFLRPRLPNRLARHLPDPKPDYLRGLSSASAHALATFGPIAKDAIPDLIDGLSDVTTANMAIYAILEIGPQPENLPAFLSLLKSTNRWEPSYALACIGRIGVATPEVLAVMTNAAAVGTSFLRTTAIDALGQLGSKANPAAAVLTRNLDDPEARIRIASAEALWSIRGKTNFPIAWLTKALDDELNHGSPPSSVPNVAGDHEMNLLKIVRLLKEARKEAKPAVPLLRAMKKENDIRFRMNAAEALWRIDGEKNGVMGSCLDAITHFDPSVRLFAVRLFSEFCVEEHFVRPEFEELLTNQDSFIRFYAARALWKLKGTTDNTLPALITGLTDHFTFYQNVQIRQLAAETLGEMGDQARPAVPALLLALKDGVVGVRMAATNSLKKIDPQAAAKAGVK